MPTVCNTFGNPSYSDVVHATHTISPTLLNEVAFNYNGNRIHILPAGVFKAPGGFHLQPHLQRAQTWTTASLTFNWPGAPAPTTT